MSQLTCIQIRYHRPHFTVGGNWTKSLHPQPLQRCYCENSGSPVSACVMRCHYSIMCMQSLHSINGLIVMGRVGNLLCGRPFYNPLYIKSVLYYPAICGSTFLKISFPHLPLKRCMQFRIFHTLVSTAVEQVVACALVTQRARVRSPVGTGFLGEVFFGVFPHL